MQGIVYIMLVSLTPAITKRPHLHQESRKAVLWAADHLYKDRELSVFPIEIENPQFSSFTDAPRFPVGLFSIDMDPLVCCVACQDRATTCVHHHPLNALQAMFSTWCMSCAWAVGPLSQMRTWQPSEKR